MEKSWRVIIRSSSFAKRAGSGSCFSLTLSLSGARFCGLGREEESERAPQRESARENKKLEEQRLRIGRRRRPSSSPPSRTGLLLLASRPTAAAAGHPSRRQRADVAQAPLRLAEEHDFSAGASEPRGKKRALDLKEQTEASFVSGEGGQGRPFFFFPPSVDLLLPRRLDAALDPSSSRALSHFLHCNIPPDCGRTRQRNKRLRERAEVREREREKHPEERK